MREDSLALMEPSSRKKSCSGFENTVRLCRYYSLVIVEICVALVCTAWVLRYHYRNPAMGKIPKWIRVSFNIVTIALFGLLYIS